VCAEQGQVAAFQGRGIGHRRPGTRSAAACRVLFPEPFELHQAFFDLRRRRRQPQRRAGEIPAARRRIGAAVDEGGERIDLPGVQFAQHLARAEAAEPARAPGQRTQEAALAVGREGIERRGPARCQHRLQFGFASNHKGVAGLRRGSPACKAKQQRTAQDPTCHASSLFRKSIGRV